jgi:hypothetical protein
MDAGFHVRWTRKRPSKKGAQCSYAERGSQDEKLNDGQQMPRTARQTRGVLRLSTKPVDKYVDDYGSHKAERLQKYATVKLVKI